MLFHVGQVVVFLVALVAFLWNLVGFVIESAASVRSGMEQHEQVQVARSRNECGA